MAIALTKRTNAGYTLVYDGITVYPSELKYFGTDNGVILFGAGMKIPRFYPPSEWTIGGVDGYTTVVSVADALDALGVLATDTLDDIKTILGTIDNMMDGNYANVNVNVAGTDVAANTGNANNQTMRVVLATDQPALTNRLLTTELNSGDIKTAIQLLDNAVDGNYLNVNVNMAGTDAATGAGNSGVTVQRVTLATDDVNTAAIKTSVASVDTKLTSGAQKTQIVDAEGTVADMAVILAVQTATITRPADTTTYTAGDTIGEVVAVKQVDTITLTGTDGTANVTLAGGLTKLATFNTSLTQTATDFVTDHAAAYLVEGIVVTSSGEDILFTAQLAGVAFVSPVITNATVDLAGTVANTTPNTVPTAITITEVAKADGGGVLIENVLIETTATQFAGKKIRIWLFKSTPTYFTGDNDGFVLKFANDMNAVPYIEVTMEALLTGSDIVVGTAKPEIMYICDDASDDMIILLQSVDEVTSPASEADFRITFNTTQV
jgi:hypothetical protein